jgi:hypothetical protein
MLNWEAASWSWKDVAWFRSYSALEDEHEFEDEDEVAAYVTARAP